MQSRNITIEKNTLIVLIISMERSEAISPRTAVSTGLNVYHADET
jgi:hypothetical protein